MSDADEILIRIKADITDLQSHMKEATVATQKFSEDSGKSMETFNRISEIALGVGLASLAEKGIEAVKDFAVESVKDSLKSEQAMRSLKIQIGDTADSLVEDLKKASGGIVDDFDLITSANKSLAMGIQQNKIPELMQVAATQAKIMGITVTQAYDEISKGIAIGSKKMLDNAGIMLDMNKAYSEFAEQNHIVGRSLSATEQELARTNAVLEQQHAIVLAEGVAAEDTKTAIDRFTVSIKQMGESAATSAINGLKAFGNELTGMSDVLKDPGYMEASQMSEAFSSSILKNRNDLIALNSELSNTESELKNITSAFQLAGNAEFNVGDAKSTRNIDTLNVALEKLKKNGNLDDMKGEEFSAAFKDMGIDINSLAEKHVVLRQEGNFEVYKTVTVQQQLNDLLTAQTEQQKMSQDVNKATNTDTMKVMQAETDQWIAKHKNSELTLKDLGSEIEAKKALMLYDEAGIKSKTQDISDGGKVLQIEQDIKKEREASIRALQQGTGLLKEQAALTMMINGSDPFGAVNDINSSLRKLDSSNPASPASPASNGGNNVYLTVGTLNSINPQDTWSTLSNFLTTKLSTAGR